MIELEKLHGFADGSLDHREQNEVAQRLSECDASRKELEAIQNLRNSLATQAGEVSCPVTWEKCRARVRELDRIERSGNFITRYSWQIVAATALIVLVGGTLSRRADSTKIPNSTLAGIISRAKAPQEGSIDPKDLDAVLKEVNSRMTQLQLVGRRSIEVAGNPANEYALLDRLGELRLLVADGKLEFEGTFSMDQDRFSAGQLAPNTMMIAWQRQGKTFVLAGDRNHLDLVRIAKANFETAE